MNCPACQNPLAEGDYLCTRCGFDLSRCPWVVIRKVYPPDDIIFESLLKSLGIPVRLLHEAIGSVYSLNSGPLAEVKIAVPEICARDAQGLLAAELEVPNEDSGEN
jgi:cobalamin biosynthesis protein CobD/CbiB